MAPRLASPTSASAYPARRNFEQPHACIVDARFGMDHTLRYPGSVAGTSLPAEIVLLVAAGMVMGFGARTAGGCTSGHGMSGISLLSPASMVATITFFATAVGLALLVGIVGGAS